MVTCFVTRISTSNIFSRCTIIQVLPLIMIRQLAFAQTTLPLVRSGKVSSVVKCFHWVSNPRVRPVLTGSFRGVYELAARLLVLASWINLLGVKCVRDLTLCAISVLEFCKTRKVKRHREYQTTQINSHFPITNAHNI